MRGRCHLFLGIIAILITTVSTSAHAYPTSVHQRIAEAAVNSSLASIGSALEDIGFTGIDDALMGKQIREWIEFGSIEEDDWFPEARFFNHFYNPITNSGLSDYPYYGLSSLEWADDIYSNDWSWRYAREYFYKGLTASSEGEREKELAHCFRSLGQVMHLIQDSGVPAHVRNDAHPYSCCPLAWGDPYEVFTKENIDALNYASSEFADWNLSISPHAPKQLWDMELYDGSNPSDSRFGGLAEYTNANFASSDTIFSESLESGDAHYFPYPRMASSALYEETLPDTSVRRKYLAIVGDTEQIAHFAVAGRFFELLDGSPRLQRLFLGFDDSCNQDYAAKLIPKAVGYSAGMLKYFFRGKLEAECVDGGLEITNLSQESLYDGSFELYYDSSDGNRKRIDIISGADVAELATDDKATIYFDPPTDFGEDEGYVIVYRGGLGNETDAVVGKLKKCTQTFYLRVTIDGRNLVYGGQQLHIQYTDKQGYTIKTNSRVIPTDKHRDERGYSMGVVGPFEVKDIDDTKPIFIGLEKERPLDASNSYLADPARSPFEYVGSEGELLIGQSGDSSYNGLNRMLAYVKEDSGGDLYYSSIDRAEEQGGSWWECICPRETLPFITKYVHKFGMAMTNDPGISEWTVDMSKKYSRISAVYSSKNYKDLEFKAEEIVTDNSYPNREKVLVTDVDLNYGLKIRHKEVRTSGASPCRDIAGTSHLYEHYIDQASTSSYETWTYWSDYCGPEIAGGGVLECTSGTCSDPWDYDCISWIRGVGTGTAAVSGRGVPLIQDEYQPIPIIQGWQFNASRDDYYMGCRGGLCLDYENECLTVSVQKNTSFSYESLPEYWY